MRPDDVSADTVKLNFWGRRRGLRGTHDARARGYGKRLGRRVRTLGPTSTVRISRVAALARGARARVTHVSHDLHRISTNLVEVFHKKHFRGNVFALPELPH